MLSSSAPSASSDAIAFDIAWQFILKARELLDQSPNGRFYLSYDMYSNCVEQLTAFTEEVYLWVDSQRELCFSSTLPDAMKTTFDLYLPILGWQGAQTRVIAHLGQSIDSRIATLSGDSIFVTGEENRKHLHCLRALSDAVIVGAGTVQADNPQLTTRAVAGSNPVRVVIDPLATLSADYGLFNDGQCRTLLIHQSSADLSECSSSFGPLILDAHDQPCHQVERCQVPGSDEQLLPGDIVSVLKKRGLRRLFVEGGGVTVSQFYNDRVLNRLHIAIAPLLVGEGVPAMQLPDAGNMKSAHRPAHAIYRMGEDILWDFNIQPDCDSNETQAGAELASTDKQDAEKSKSPDASPETIRTAGVQRIV